jgi:hypothetical protein
MGQFLDQGKLIPLRQNGIYTLPTCVILTESVGWDLVASVYWRTKIRSFSAHKREVLQRFASGVKILARQKSIVPKCLRIKGRVFGKTATSASFYARSEKLQHFLQ